MKEREAVINTFPPQDHEQMAGVWIELMANSKDVEALSRCKLGYCDVLIAQQKFTEAAAILLELYEAVGQTMILNRLAQVKRAAGDSEAAVNWLLLANATLPPEAHRHRAGNAFALARIRVEQGQLQAAIVWLRQTIEMARQAGADGLEGQARLLMGQIAKDQLEPDLALYYYVTAQEAFERAGDACHHQALDTLIQQLRQAYQATPARLADLA